MKTDPIDSCWPEDIAEPEPVNQGLTVQERALMVGRRGGMSTLGSTVHQLLATSRDFVSVSYVSHTPYIPLQVSRLQLTGGLDLASEEGIVDGPYDPENTDLSWSEKERSAVMWAGLPPRRPSQNPVLIAILDAYDRELLDLAMLGPDWLRQVIAAADATTQTQRQEHRRRLLANVRTQSGNPRT